MSTEPVIKPHEHLLENHENEVFIAESMLFAATKLGYGNFINSTRNGFQGRPFKWRMGMTKDEYVSTLIEGQKTRLAASKEALTSVNDSLLDESQKHKKQQSLNKIEDLNAKILAYESA